MVLRERIVLKSFLLLKLLLLLNYCHVAGNFDDCQVSIWQIVSCIPLSSTQWFIMVGFNLTSDYQNANSSPSKLPGGTNRILRPQSEQLWIQNGRSKKPQKDKPTY